MSENSIPSKINHVHLYFSEKKTSLLDDVHVPAINIGEKEEQEKVSNYIIFPIIFHIVFKQLLFIV